jgi:zinc/manganese transport system substrate-binding protein
MRMLVSALSLWLALATGSRADAKLHVVGTIETFADVARQIGGDRVEVTSLSKGWTDPHFVEGKPSLVLVLNRADLLIHVGLELEIGWLPPLVLAARNDKIQLGAPGNLDVSQEIPIIEVPMQRVTRAMGDIHPLGNPHYYLAPDEIEIVAREIADRLKLLDPDGTSTYDANLSAFEKKLKEKRAEWEQISAPLRGVKIVTYHQSWGYVAKWLGLIQAGFVEPKPGIPPSAQHIAQLIALMKQQKVRMIIAESFYPRNLVQLVADKSGAKLVTLPGNVGGDPGAKDFFSLEDEIVHRLVDAAK